MSIDYRWNGKENEQKCTTNEKKKKRKTLLQREEILEEEEKVAVDEVEEVARNTVPNQNANEGANEQTNEWYMQLNKYQFNVSLQSDQFCKATTTTTMRRDEHDRNREQNNLFWNRFILVRFPYIPMPLVVSIGYCGWLCMYYRFCCYCLVPRHRKQCYICALIFQLVRWFC